MTDDTHDSHESPIDGAPVWVRALQAAVVGIAAGLAIHMLLSLVVLQGKELWSRPTAPAACKKNNPAKDSGTPSGRQTPSVGAVGALVPFVPPGKTLLIVRPAYPRNIS
jgi:hypothetical protein